ncbi:MAG: exopolyphosphatase, partial [Sphingomonadales bacterium BRH_c42]
GGSLELVRIGNGGVEHATSLPLGTLRLGEYRDGDEPAMVRRLADRLVQAGWGSAIEAPLYLVGGTWRAIAVHDMARRKYPLSDPHGYELDAGRTAKLAARIAAAAPERLLIDPRISIMRSEIMPDAAVLLEAMLETLMPERIVFSSWGLREGLLYDRLPDHTRAQDPLLAGVAIFAAQCGAPPVLASHIAGWTADVAPSRAAGAERIRLAANMLALASMQLEPNLRLDHAVDWALHKRWIALDAAGRAMIAAAVAANRNVADRPKGLERLASQEELDEAISWGLATRLARRLGARSRQSLQVSRLTADNGALVLRLRDSHSNLFSLANERDMAALAEHMGLRAELRLVPDGEAL